MGIPAFTRDFNKNMIVCRMEHEKPHKILLTNFFVIIKLKQRYLILKINQALLQQQIKILRRF